MRLFVGIALCVPATLPGWGGGRSVSESQLLKLFEVCVFRKALLRFLLYGAPYLQLLAQGGGASLRLRPCKEVECSDAIDSDGDEKRPFGPGADDPALRLEIVRSDRYLVDPASSHMLVSKIKPCMSQYKFLYGETANGSLKQL